MQHVLAVLVHVDVVEVLGPVDLSQQPPHLSGVLSWRTYQQNLLAICTTSLVLEKFHPKVRNHGEGPY